MSNDGRNRGTSSNYRKPPVEHQFKKGASGNPAGRPPKKTVQPGAGLGGGIADRLSAMALDEAIRPVTVREGNKVSEIPALQAVMRTMFRAAAQGDSKAGRQVIELLQRAESGRASTALEALEHAVHYREIYGPLFEKHEREGLAPPDIYPHPDDMIINQLTGEVTIDGPLTKEQAGAQQAVREQALKSLPRYFEVEAALKEQPKNSMLRREFKELKKYLEFLTKDAARRQRHEALRQSRLALEPESDEPEDGDTTESDAARKEEKDKPHG